MKRKNIVSWLLYDTINSLVIIAGAVYFTKWLIADAGISDGIVATLVSLASGIFILIGPKFGSSLISEKKTWSSLLSTTFLVGLFATFLGFPGINEPNHLTIYFALAAFFFLNIFYQLSLVAYNAYLPRLVTKGNLQLYSGLGESFGQIGSVLGIFIAIGLLSFKWIESEIIRLFLILGPFVLLLSCIAVFALRANKTFPSDDEAFLIVQGDDYAQRPFKELLRDKTFFLIILIVFLFNNAFASLQVFSSSYLSIAAGWDEQAIGLGIAGTLIGAALGAIFTALLKNKISIRTLLLMGLLIFASSISSLALLGTKNQILLSLFGGGFGFGLLASVSRVCVVLLAKQFSQGEKFGVYAAVSRTSAVFGPLLWAGTLSLMNSHGEIVSRQYGMGMLAMMAWIALIVGFFTKLRSVGENNE